MTVAKWELGKEFYFDNIISADSTIACATCHDPRKGYTDQLAVSLGNMLVALLSELGNLPRAQFFWTFAGLVFVASLLFGVRAAFYRYKTYVQ